MKKTFEFYACSPIKTQRNNYQGESWQWAKVQWFRFPSGLRKCLVFPDGQAIKIELCKVKNKREVGEV